MKSSKFFLPAMLVITGLACGCESTGPENTPADSHIRYPYVADASRQEQLLRGYRKLFSGMPEKEVIRIMGEPDERNVFYANSDNFEKRHADGTTLVYLLERKQPYGGLVQRQEKSFRIGLDNSGRVNKIETEGLNRLPISRPK